MKQIAFPDGTLVPALGQGTWRMGEDRRLQAKETAALRSGIERGMRVIDTAEMYGDGATESFLGEALEGLREAIFLVSKAYPENASRHRLAAACEASLKRLRTDRLDLYLLHWRGSVPLAETVEGMEALRKSGKIKLWGVSNLDRDDMEELMASGGGGCATDQILYNLTRRGPEYDLAPWLQQHRMPLMAYSPIEQGRIVKAPALSAIADRKGATPAQIALAWVLSRPGILAIPKASSVGHVAENAAAESLTLDAADLAELDQAFAPPQRLRPLEML